MIKNWTFRKYIAHIHCQAMITPGSHSIIVLLDTKNLGSQSSSHHFAQTISLQNPSTVKFHHRNHFVMKKAGNEETRTVQGEMQKVSSNYRYILK